MTSLLLKCFVKDYQNTADETVRRRYGTLGGTVGIIINLLLFCLKLAAGLLTGAISVTADAFNNLSDAGSSVITLVGFKIAGKKGDREHPFGHGRAEYVSGLLISVVIIIVGVELIKGSVEKIISPETVSFSVLSIVILGCSVAVKLWMALFSRRLSRAISSAALAAVAKDSLSDVAATSAVIVGLVIAQLCGFNPDGYIGAAVALFIIISGINAARDTLGPLLGTAPSPEFVQDIRSTVCAHPEVLGIHDLIVHDYGPGRRMISLHAEVSSEEDLIAIHDVIDNIENELKEKYGSDATIHMDPLALHDEQTNRLKQQVAEIIAAQDSRLSFHDFRLVRGPTHTNVLFDLVVPFDFSHSDEQISAILTERIESSNPNCFAKIQIDKDYTGHHD